MHTDLHTLPTDIGGASLVLHQPILEARTIPVAATAAPEMFDHPDEVSSSPIRCQQFLGELLRHYSRDAA